MLHKIAARKEGAKIAADRHTRLDPQWMHHKWFQVLILTTCKYTIAMRPQRRTPEIASNILAQVNLNKMFALV